MDQEIRIDNSKSKVPRKKVTKSTYQNEFTTSIMALITISIIANKSENNKIPVTKTKKLEYQLQVKVPKKNKIYLLI
ncbi:4453_t:CDS:2 [Gigaspora margarita]|uniref:4453_t:CDS:1 n=1 Tax=Gigaspora margarita TaxID=4874 RepID=A0ABM8W391_GIGMA|nr:4453_t:CDS:2 [Gigaspora margarita]